MADINRPRLRRRRACADRQTSTGSIPTSSENGMKSTEQLASGSEITTGEPAISASSGLFDDLTSLRLGAAAGGFQRSSQHSEVGGCDEHSKAAIGTVWTGAITFTGRPPAAGVGNR